MFQKAVLAEITKAPCGSSSSITTAQENLSPPTPFADTKTTNRCFTKNKSSDKQTTTTTTQVMKSHKIPLLEAGTREVFTQDNQFGVMVKTKLEETGGLTDWASTLDTRQRGGAPGEILHDNNDTESELILVNFQRMTELVL